MENDSLSTAEQGILLYTHHFAHRMLPHLRGNPSDKDGSYVAFAVMREILRREAIPSVALGGEGTHYVPNEYRCTPEQMEEALGSLEEKGFIRIQEKVGPKRTQRLLAITSEGEAWLEAHPRSPADSADVTQLDVTKKPRTVD